MEALSNAALPEPALLPVTPSAPAKSAQPRPARARAEPLTPFMPWSDEERAPLPEALPLEAQEGQLLVALLREPGAIVERLLEPARLQGLVLGSVGTLVACTSLFAASASAARGVGHGWALSAGLTSLNVLMALAASLGPIYAASMLVAARVPLARLVAALLASAATGSLLLAGLAPPLYLLWKLDPEWLGPLALLGAFVLSGVTAGIRIHLLLHLLAEAVTRAALVRPSAVLSEGDAYRVGILARISWMMLSFTSALAFWAFEALG